MRQSGNAASRIRKNSSVPSFVGKSWQALVLDEVVRYQVAEPGDVSGVDPLVGAPHRRSVIHGRPLVCGRSMRCCMRSDCAGGRRRRHHSIE
jgi:hypothetical protein